jgi:hypothetical protein
MTPILELAVVGALKLLGFLVFSLLVVSAIRTVVADWFKQRSICSVCQYKQIEEARLAFVERDNELVRVRHEINTAAMLEQQLIALGKHPKLLPNSQVN